MKNKPKSILYSIYIKPKLYAIIKTSHLRRYLYTYHIEVPLFLENVLR